jgi:hypothetical protein
MGISAGPNSISDNLAFHIDPANPRSYAGVGTVIYDLSGNGKTSYFTNGALYQNYQKGTVLVDGNDDYISFPTFNLTSPFTISVWANNIIPDSPIFGGYGPGVGYGNGEVLFYFMPDDMRIMIAGAASGAAYFVFPNPKYNAWYNFVLTRDLSNNVKMYRNGIGSTSNNQTYSSTFQINQIGRYSNFTNLYNLKGHLGETKFYNRALSESEVLQNYNASKKRYVPEENIVTNGLVLNLDAANPSSYSGSGNTSYDLSGFGNTATLVNGTGFDVTGGGMFVFDGSNDYVTIGDKLDLGLDSYTFSCWFKLNSVSVIQCIFSKSVGTNVDNRYALYINNNKLQSFLQGNQGVTGPDVDIASSVTLSTGNWYHVSSVYDRSGTLKLYVNGSLDSSATISQWQNVNIQSSYTFKIGAYASPGDVPAYFTNGIITSFLGYNRALSALEVMQNFNAMRERYNI